MLGLHVFLLYEHQNLELSHLTRHLAVFLDFLDGGVSFTFYISLMVTKWDLIKDGYMVS